MKDVKQIAKAAADSLTEFEKVGRAEFFGLEPLPPGRVVDPEKCRCGGGCESFLECDFWYWARKTSDCERNAHRQFQIGKYRVDSLFYCDGQKVVVELDGKEFHQDKRKDLERDKEILRTVDCVIRIPYAAMHFYPQATFCCLASWYPRFKIRAIPSSCFSSEELQEEIDKLDPYEPTARRQWIEDVEADYEVWYACDTFGFAGSVKVWLARGHWNTAMIKRQQKPDRE